MVPRRSLVGFTTVLDAAMGVRGKVSPICRTRVDTILDGHRYDGSRATRELGLEYTPVEETFRRTNEWGRRRGPGDETPSRRRPSGACSAGYFSDGTAQRARVARGGGGLTPAGTGFEPPVSVSPRTERDGRDRLHSPWWETRHLVSAHPNSWLRSGEEYAKIGHREKGTFVVSSAAATAVSTKEKHMEIGRLYLGSIAGPLGPATPFNCYAIDHPDGLTLVDTGFGTTLALSGGAQPDDPNSEAGVLVMGEYELPWIRRSTIDALADHDIEPGDVKYIINTHVGDHSGDNHLFPEATFIVQEAEVEWARKNQPHGPASLDEWDFPGAKLELLSGKNEEVLPGLRCIFTPGHTPGHQSVVLEDDGKTILFCGDAVYTEGFWDDPDQIKPGHPAFGMQVQTGEEGLETWRESVAKLEALNPDEVHFAHDKRYKHKHGAHSH
jgi:N-acyl homoserine lactone hydrolase